MTMAADAEPCTTYFGVCFYFSYFWVSLRMSDGSDFYMQGAKAEIMHTLANGRQSEACLIGIGSSLSGLYEHADYNGEGE